MEIGEWGPGQIAGPSPADVEAGLKSIHQRKARRQTAIRSVAAAGCLLAIGIGSFAVITRDSTRSQLSVAGSGQGKSNSVDLAKDQSNDKIMFTTFDEVSVIDLANGKSVSKLADSKTFAGLGPSYASVQFEGCKPSWSAGLFACEVVTANAQKALVVSKLSRPSDADVIIDFQPLTKDETTPKTDFKFTTGGANLVYVSQVNTPINGVTVPATVVRAFDFAQNIDNLLLAVAGSDVDLEAPTRDGNSMVINVAKADTWFAKAESKHYELRVKDPVIANTTVEDLEAVKVDLPSLYENLTDTKDPDQGGSNHPGQLVENVQLVAVDSQGFDVIQFRYGNESTLFKAKRGSTDVQRIYEYSDDGLIGASPDQSRYYRTAISSDEDNMATIELFEILSDGEESLLVAMTSKLGLNDTYGTFEW